MFMRESPFTQSVLGASVGATGRASAARVSKNVSRFEVLNYSSLKARARFLL